MSPHSVTCPMGGGLSGHIPERFRGHLIGPLNSTSVGPSQFEKTCNFSHYSAPPGKWTTKSTGRVRNCTSCRQTRRHTPTPKMILLTVSFQVLYPQNGSAVLKGLSVKCLGMHMHILRSIVFYVTLAGFGFAALRRRGGVVFGFATGLTSLSSLSVSELSSEDSELVLSILEDVEPSLIGRVVEGIRSKDTTTTVRVGKTN